MATRSSTRSNFASPSPGTSLGLNQRSGMPACLRILGDQGTRDGLVLSEGYKKDTRSRLRNEMHSVNHRRSEPVVQFGQRRSNGREIPSFVRRQTPVNVFENDHAGAASLLRQAPDQFPKRPECAGSSRDLVALPTKSAIASGERQVLARKRRPREIDRVGREGLRASGLATSRMFDVSRAPIRLISLDFHPIEIIGE